MNTLQLLHRLWDHTVWADKQLWPAIVPHAGREPWREYLHILGAEEVWLARLERRPANAAVWPELNVEQAAALRQDIEDGYRRYLGALRTDALTVPIDYTNTAGKAFASTPADILTHVALHGQYHRGKVNLLLRQAAADPAPVDFIAFVRGAPAAVTPS